MLGQVVASGEALATLATFERFLLGVQGTVMALEMFLSTEASMTDVADEDLGRVLGQGLLAATTVDGGTRQGGVS